MLFRSRNLFLLIWLSVGLDYGAMECIRLHFTEAQKLVSLNLFICRPRLILDYGAVECIKLRFTEAQKLVSLNLVTMVTIILACYEVSRR